LFSIPSYAELPNITLLPNDLQPVAMSKGKPQAGKRVWEKLPAYEKWDIAHAIYLPADWKPGKKYPVIFEYPGNGNYSNKYGDKSDGTIEGCALGYGLTEGKGVIWVCLPFVDSKAKRHSIQWWGDAEETAKYCKLAVAHVCKTWGGDTDRLILAGFSRGAIACNYIGLRDDEIAKLWRGFFVHSHYDGVRKWNYADSDAESARKRLARLGNRPQWISHEGSVDDIKTYLKDTGKPEQFTFTALPYVNHSPLWLYKETPERKYARAWLAKVLKVD
jgi:acetyl esterase/lipase